MKKVYLLGFMAATAASWASASADTVAVTTPPAGCPKAFQGFHLGGNIGVGFLNNKQTHSRAFPTGVNGAFVTERSISNRVGGSGVDGGIGVGYTHRFCNWALGVAFDANWANSSGSLKVNNPGNNTTTLKAQLRNSLQLYARLGYVMREIAMPFVGLGWDNSQWKGTSSTNYAAGIVPGGVAFRSNANQSKRFNSFLWKAGVDFLATKHVVVGFEYTGTTAGSKSKTVVVNNLATASTEQIKTSVKPQYNKFALTAKIVY